VKKYVEFTSILYVAGIKNGVALLHMRMKNRED